MRLFRGLFELALVITIMLVVDSLAGLAISLAMKNWRSTLRNKIEIEVVGKVMGFRGGKCNSCQRLTSLSPVGTICGARLGDLEKREFEPCEGVIRDESDDEASARLMLEAEMHGNGGVARIHLSYKRAVVVLSEREETRNRRVRVVP